MITSLLGPLILKVHGSFCILPVCSLQGCSSLRGLTNTYNKPHKSAPLWTKHGRPTAFLSCAMGALDTQEASRQRPASDMLRKPHHDITSLGWLYFFSGNREAVELCQAALAVLAMLPTRSLAG